MRSERNALTVRTNSVRNHDTDSYDDDDDDDDDNDNDDGFSVSKIGRASGRERV